MAECRADAEQAFDHFLSTYNEAKDPKASECLARPALPARVCAKFRSRRWVKSLIAASPSAVTLVVRTFRYCGPMSPWIKRSLLFFEDPPANETLVKTLRLPWSFEAEDLDNSS